MKINCFLFGCVWTERNLCVLGHEAMQCMRCSRCGSYRYMPADIEEV
ncbi:MAG TPA: PSPA7_2676 family Cys-rich small protein [Pseudomonas sp.]|nr:PSPA7_2676 family Cys-rich small protein [Pseudomonas sp.]